MFVQQNKRTKFIMCVRTAAIQLDALYAKGMHQQSNSNWPKSSLLLIGLHDKFEDSFLKKVVAHILKRIICYYTLCDTLLTCKMGHR